MDRASFSVFHPSLWLLTLLFNLVTAQTVSIAKDAGLLAQRDCVQICIGGTGAGTGHENLLQAVGCGNSNADSCLCRADLRPPASQYLSSCLTTDFTTCSGSPDYTAAVSIYNRYCSFTGPAVVTATPTPTSATNDVNVNGVTTVTQTTAPTVTVVVSSSSSSSVIQPSFGELGLIAVATGLLLLAKLAVPGR
ncbi:hypothetical protein EPUS_06526 [Endocarpon pusillum Z07020]|uniref:Extracellular membrane protein CFEM domain-containing protein n=1 Tax=Endocarpon pusillum (strain Z07020 / HMAS-L-300199) TaxID=1263415 RepID=U1G3T5_ENDPU|nr:uncharacterized protein EPUS_06526 [Endocarpon pusillum Z07020]ERF71967.1 hypothetical protein EPUS_06526 [Endocarpon pusillum Z07020]